MISNSIIRIFLVDDHHVFRNGVAAIMAHQPSLKVVGEAATAEEALQKLGDTETDILLIDIDMPGMNGLEAMPLLHERFQSIKVLVFSMYDDEAHAKAMLRAGANGYLLKSAPLNELLQAVHSVAVGGTYLSAEITQKLVDGLKRSPQQNLSPSHDNLLTGREKEVLRLVAKGCTNKQISEQLFISPRTVDSHRRHIMEKLDLHNAAALSHYAATHGLLDHE